MEKLKLFFTGFILSFFVCYANAYDLEKDGIYYNANSSSGYSLTVTYRSTEYKSYSGDIIIPDTVLVGRKKYVVTAIGQDAFKNCPFLTSVKMPSSITTIGRYAFSSCSSLEQISIPSSVTTIGAYAFDYCRNLHTIRFEDGTSTLKLGDNTKSWTIGSHNETKGLFSTCPVDSVYLGRNISKEYNYGFSYAPFNGWDIYVEVGEKVTSMISYLFSGSPQSIKMLGKNPPKANENTFRYNESTTLYVPFSALETYKNTSIWCNFKNIVPVYNDYVASFVIDDFVVEKKSITEGDTIVPPIVPDKEGYTFDGWINLPKIMPSEDITIRGEYSVNYYKLIYIIDNEIYNTFDIAYGTRIKPIEAPQKDGFAFSGWINLPETMPAKDVVVVGVFSPETGINETFTNGTKKNLIIYNLNGQKISKDKHFSKQFYIINGRKVFIE